VRTARIRALSFVRDRNAPHERIEEAAKELGELSVKYPGGTLTQAWGEALARNGETRSAYDMLAADEKRDVIVSAWAHAALARAAVKVGDQELAKTALQRCEATATSAKICRGEYPSPPLLRGKPYWYGLTGLVFLLGLLCRKSARFAPWKDHGARFFATTIGGATMLAFLFPRLPAIGIAAAVVAVLVLFFAQPRMFLHAVRRGKVKDVFLRPVAAEDASLPFVPFFKGPLAGATLERTIHNPTYRIAAREPFLRIGRKARSAARSEKKRRVLLALALAVVGLFTSAGALFLLFGARYV
jgi:hypothetical protein